MEFLDLNNPRDSEWCGFGGWLWEQGLNTQAKEQGPSSNAGDQGNRGDGVLWRGPASSEPSLTRPEVNKGAETWRMCGALSAVLTGPCPSLPPGVSHGFQSELGPSALPDLPVSPWRMFEWRQDPPKMSSPTFTSTEAIQPGSHLHSLGARLPGFKSRLSR